MHTINQVKAGLLQYIDKELLPNLSQLSDVMLNNFCASKAAHLLGVASSDGQINVEALRNVCNSLVPDAGLSFTVLGVEIRFTHRDIDAIYKLIKEA